MPQRYRDDPWDLPDVPTFLANVARRIDLTAGLDVLVVVDDSDARHVLGLEPLARITSGADPWDVARTVLEEPMQRLCPSWEVAPGPPRCTAHVLRCREGRVVHARDDVRLGYGLLYSKNLLTVYCGDIVMLTPHGWRVHDRAGASPTLTSLGGRGLRTVELPEGA